MDAKTLWTTLAVAAVALAGCADEGDDTPALTEEDCAALGLVLGEEEVMHESDNGTMEHHSEPACVPAGPPATVTVQGVPATVQAYTPIDVTWVLNTQKDEAHAMRTDVRFDTQANVGTDCTPAADLQKPDDWGQELGKAEHQNFEDGQSYSATWTPAEPGMYCFRAYALVSQTNVWSEAVTVEVTEVQPTGTTHTVTIMGPGPFGSMAPADLAITLGDAVDWANEDLDAYTISSTTGPEAFTTTPGTPFTFLVPGSWSYEATGDFLGSAGSYSGTITVTAPTAPAA